MAEAEQLRLFVACELPSDVRGALGAIQDDLRRQGAPRLRWVRPEGIHLTLKFLGDVEASRVDKISAALSAVVQPFELRLRLAALGGFGGSRLRVVWAGVDGEVDALASLAGVVDDALMPLGFERERRRFAAHLTLARVPDRLSMVERQRAGALIEGYRLGEQPTMMITRMALIRSMLGPQGSVYERLGSFPEKEA